MTWGKLFLCWLFGPNSGLDLKQSETVDRSGYRNSTTISTTAIVLDGAHSPDIYGRSQKPDRVRREGGGRARGNPRNDLQSTSPHCTHCNYLGIVTHLVLGFCDEMARSSSSSAPDFLNFFTKLLTAFSLHLPSASEHFLQPKRRFTTGGVNGSIATAELFNCYRSFASHHFHSHTLGIIVICRTPLPYCSLITPRSSNQKHANA